MNRCTLVSRITLLTPLLVACTLVIAFQARFLSSCDAAATMYSSKIPVKVLSLGLSADENWISYEIIRDSDGPWDSLHVMSWNGKRRFDLGRIDIADLERNFCWATLGPEIAWTVTDRKSDKRRIMIRNIETGRKLAFAPLCQADWPSLSPDNSLLAVTGTEHSVFNPDFPSTEYQRVFVLSSSNGKIKRRGGIAVLPRKGPAVWSPDASKLAYCDLNRVLYGPVNVWDLATKKVHRAAEAPFEGNEQIDVYGTWIPWWLDNSTVAWNAVNGVYVADYKQPSKCLLMTEGFLVDVLPVKPGRCKALLWNNRKEDESKLSIYLVELKRQQSGQWAVHELGSLESELFMDNGHAFPVVFARLSRRTDNTVIWLDKSNRLVKTTFPPGN
jgi:hypothetical protein